MNEKLEYSSLGSHSGLVLYETFQIRNMQKIDRSRSKLMSFLLSVTFIDVDKDTS